MKNSFIPQQFSNLIHDDKKKLNKQINVHALDINFLLVKFNYTFIFYKNNIMLNKEIEINDGYEEF